MVNLSVLIGVVHSESEALVVLKENSVIKSSLNPNNDVLLHTDFFVVYLNVDTLHFHCRKQTHTDTLLDTLIVISQATESSVIILSKI